MGDFFDGVELGRSVRGWCGKCANQRLITCTIAYMYTCTHTYCAHILHTLIPTQLTLFLGPRGSPLSRCMTSGVHGRIPRCVVTTPSMSASPGGVSKFTRRWTLWSEKRVSHFYCCSPFRCILNMWHAYFDYAGVNSFKMFLAYKDVFMLRDGEVSVCVICVCDMCV